MLNIDLFNNGHVLVSYYLGLKNHEKLKDFIVLKKEIGTLDRIEIKPPWKNLFYADEWELKSGKMYDLSEKALHPRSHIIFSTRKYDYEDLTKIMHNENLSLSLIQLNSVNKLRIANLSLCKYEGTEIRKGITRFDFEVLNCNMIYKK